MCLQYKSFENNVGQREIACYKQFLLNPQCFLPVYRTSCHFHQTWNCCLQDLSARESLKFVIWERVNKQLFNFAPIISNIIKTSLFPILCFYWIFVFQRLWWLGKRSVQSIGWRNTMNTSVLVTLEVTEVMLKMLFNTNSVFSEDLSSRHV